MKVWITKYALTQGIRVVENAKHCADISPNMIAVRHSGGLTEHFHGTDWHRTKEAAVEKATIMRYAKIMSLKRQIAKLESLKFD